MASFFPEGTIFKKKTLVVHYKALIPVQTDHKYSFTDGRLASECAESQKIEMRALWQDSGTVPTAWKKEIQISSNV